MAVVGGLLQHSFFDAPDAPAVCGALAANVTLARDVLTREVLPQNATCAWTQSSDADAYSILAFVVFAFGCGSAFALTFLEYVARAFLAFEAFVLYMVLSSTMEEAQPDDTGAKKVERPKWIIFGEVYDLSPWMDRHPGGALVLQQTMGTDCSAVFASSHTFRGGSMLKSLEPYWTRHAEPDEMDVSSRFHWKNTPAHDKMRSELREHFKGRSIKAPYWVLALYSAWSCVLFWATKRWFMTGELSIAILLGIAIWYASVDIIHAGMHFAIFDSPRANLVLAYFFGMWSYLPSSWIRQHNLLHHTHTNHEEDTDLHHFHYFDDIGAVWFQRMLGFHPFGGWRLSEHTPMKSRYRGWLRMFPIYFFSTGLALSLIEPPILYVTKRYLGSKQRFAFPGWELVLAWTQYAVVVGTIGAATYMHGAFAALLPLFTFGLIFYIFTQVSHANDASDRAVAAEWAVDQVRYTRGDYSFDSMLWAVISSGLHLQSVHHVFPSVHWAHYPAIHRIVWNAASEHREPKTLWQAVREHFAFVSKLNSACE
eukprot:TRINITY_DN1572_c0_g6_i1.p1 TRINITY_DN1572_c0_g6~~TRINITY_DN1572_c0_g6_i1.p1  ORF type:complete len:538 (-),score=71.97 TRINITY_DN1572_c0_g6_i1:379-1992(-)